MLGLGNYTSTGNRLGAVSQIHLSVARNPRPFFARRWRSVELTYAGV